MTTEQVLCLIIGIIVFTFGLIVSAIELKVYLKDKKKWKNKKNEL